MSTLANYNLACPDKQSCLDTFTKAFDKNRAELIWKEANQVTGITDGGESIESLEKIFHYLSEQSGPTGIYGLSLKVRLMTYKNILKAQKRSAS